MAKRRPTPAQRAALQALQAAVARVSVVWGTRTSASIKAVKKAASNARVVWGD